MPNKHPCEKCKIKKSYAKMGFHWHDKEDCPYKCPYVRKENENANVAQVKHGEWTSEIKIGVKQVKGEIPVPEKYIHAQCSNCLHCFMMIRKEQYKYCPNCGARMDSELQKEG